jgi:UDP-glucose 4-epimerase
MRTLVTGGCGYIGTHLAHALVDRGDTVAIIDDLSEGRTDFLPKDVTLHTIDCGNTGAVAPILEAYRPDVVFHLAGSIVQPESISDPLTYYRNNSINSLNFLSVCLETGVRQVVFSSTAAVYGSQVARPIVEGDPIHPETPYGRSKAMTEWLLEDFARISDLRYTALRYFNVVGADPELRCGQCSRQATHLLKIAMEVATGQRDGLSIFGSDYPTRDGTCIRDYLHVTDLVEAHLLAADDLVKNRQNRILNLGTGTGFTVREVISRMENVLDIEIDVRTEDRRPGDPATLCADSREATAILGWSPTFSNLDTILRTAWDWENRLKSIDGI